MRSFQDSIEQMLWPEKREQGRGARRQGARARSTGRPSTSYLRGPGRLPARRAAAAARAAATARCRGSFGGRRHRDRPDPDGHAGQPAGQPRAAAGRAPTWSSAPSTCGSCSSCCIELKHDLQGAADERERRGAARGTSRNLATRLLALSKCPDFVVNRGHYFGTERVQGRARAERRRQARADRVPEDLLGAAGRMDTEGVPVRGLRLRRRRLGRRRRHAGRAAGRGRAHASCCSRPAATRAAAAATRDPGGNRLPDDYDVPLPRLRLRERRR